MAMGPSRIYRLCRKPVYRLRPVSTSGMTAIAAPKGVYDVVGAQAQRFDVLENSFRETTARYGYERVRIPVFERTDLFVRSVGEATDIVRKEMYTFTDRADRSLTLRPEGTAGVVRCFVEHHYDQEGLPWKVAYDGPMFRAENVQRGRHRQFYQLGIEAIGVDDPALDVEVIALGWDFLSGLGLCDLNLLVNTMGRPDEREDYVADLREHMLGSAGDLAAEDQERLERNPLRILDSKDPALAPVLTGAPRLRDYLDDRSTAHFASVLAGLDEIGVPYTTCDRLVRGLDYYTSTTFEYTSGSLDAAQNALGGGGHYDGLVEMLGGPALGGIGFALGVERILLACEAEDVFGTAGPRGQVVDVVVLQAGDVGVAVQRLVRDLRKAGIATDTSYGGRSLKAQFRHADRLGARLAIVVGERDLERGVVTIRDLTSGAQSEVNLDNVTEVISS